MKEKFPYDTLTDLRRSNSYWYSLYQALMKMPECETCKNKDKEKEAWDILLGVWEALNSEPPGSGCISVSNHVLDKIGKNMGHGKNVDIRRVSRQGKPRYRKWLYNRTTEKLGYVFPKGVEYISKCFVIETIATHGYVFRHQAVVIYSRCKPNLKKSDNPIIDLHWSNGIFTTGPIWRKYSDWKYSDATGSVREGY